MLRLGIVIVIETEIGTGTRAPRSCSTCDKAHTARLEGFVSSCTVNVNAARAIAVAVVSWPLSSRFRRRRRHTHRCRTDHA